MSTHNSGLDVPVDPDLNREYQALVQFIHQVPVGLIQARRSGLITMMNPMATQLLAPLGFGDGELNVFEILDKSSSDVRLLVQGLTPAAGVLCENFRIHLPETDIPDTPIALGITVVQLLSDADGLMVVVTDDSSNVRLQKLQMSWVR